jgi:predicted nucleic acid-binding Zn ribbon protein
MISENRECIICGKTFVGYGEKRCCSSKCKNQYKQQRRLEKEEKLNYVKTLLTDDKVIRFLENIVRRK